MYRWTSSRAGGIAGLLGSLGDAAVHYLCFFVFKTTTTAHYISALIFPLKQVTPLRYACGLLAHFAAGLPIGLFLALLLHYGGLKNAYLKGMGLGSFTWVIHTAIIPNLISPRPYVYRTEAEALVDLLAHLVFGLLAAWYLLRTASPVALEAHPPASAP